MSLATLHSRARSGIRAPLVTIEVHLANGLPALSIVGLPEMAVKESKDRVRGALLNSGFEFPARRITINLAPADLPKEGGRFDLAIALGILAASGQIPHLALDQYEIIGELALSGALRPVRGVLPVALAAREAGRGLILPEGSAAEASLVSRIPLFPANHLLAVCDHLIKGDGIAALAGFAAAPVTVRHPDLADVRGQTHAKRALEIAAAGSHSLLMIGPPGTGKSMLASRLPGILPGMSEQEALETAAIRSISSLGFSAADWRQRPFRAPHHTASGVALVGGGGNPRPGEISLAHNGVMFLDELPEFDRKVLEVLREPLESGQVTISRAARQEQFPARFQLIAAMNPCPCGYLGDSSGQLCRCSSDQVARYRGRISGPLLDRIDMTIEVPRLPAQALQESGPAAAETSETVRARVEQCRQRQLVRNGCPNSQLAGRRLDETCGLSAEASQLITRAMDQLGLSARAYHRILRLARTIADLVQSDTIHTAHLSEAIGYRRQDRRN
ncbi:YifB family Mg chelatase-like AAA ATPase [Sedimenticola hydrogenitrophicus]|uniref:YifB family Mg chelatase-like AAA ATPase n=1 Tax=Sedimenticola hydrogenitrophicus TaxID=2967975 RepID=UPI0021A4A416|nr:YifB family Mg chelatase-like AAA ATPase [Sedimenticola hydrogenitrophicus]